jgi:hypothetical protein
LPARILEHARDLGDAQSAEEGHDAGHDPDENEELRRAQLRGHESGFFEDAGADDRADSSGDGGDEPHLAAQL